MAEYRLIQHGQVIAQYAGGAGGALAFLRTTADFGCVLFKREEGK